VGIHPAGMIRGPGRRLRLGHMNGWLMWGLILPILLVVAGIISISRRKRRR